MEQMKRMWERCRAELSLFAVCSGKHRGFLRPVKTVLCLWPHVSGFSESAWTSWSFEQCWQPFTLSRSVPLHPYLFSFCCFDTVCGPWWTGVCSRAAVPCPGVGVDLGISPGRVFLCQPPGAAVFAAVWHLLLFFYTLLAWFCTFLWINTLEVAWSYCIPHTSSK